MVLMVLLLLQQAGLRQAALPAASTTRWHNASLRKDFGQVVRLICK
jgi:hypothetical protein